MMHSHSPNLPYDFRAIARIALAVSAPVILLSFALNND